MRRTCARALLLTVVAILGAVPGHRLAAQGTRADSIPDARFFEAARRVIAGAVYATFITLDETGRPRSRTVQPQAPDSTFTVWFATNPRTRKVGDIARDGRVVLHYFDPAISGYVSLVGRAQVVRDRATKNAHWATAWDAFYPDRDTSVVLVRVTAERLEVVATKLGVDGDKATWRPVMRALPLRPAR